VGEAAGPVLNVVTSVCVDVRPEDAGIGYPMLGDTTADARRLVYWKCAYAFLCSSLRSNPGARHCLYTNDAAPVTWRGIDLRARLAALGVAIEQVPFEAYAPPTRLTTRYKNGFYKHEVIRALGALPAGERSVLVDADCLAPRPFPLDALEPGRLYVLDIYRRSDPERREPHDLSMADMGEVYRRLDPTTLPRTRSGSAGSSWGATARPWRGRPG
jgi:hypothetical protein